jgi:hypothetical protein
LLAYGVGAAVIARAFGSPFAYVLLSLTVGDLLMTYVIARATVLGVLRGGLVWRGTAYPTAVLRAGQRVAM